LLVARRTLQKAMIFSVLEKRLEGAVTARAAVA